MTEPLVSVAMPLYNAAAHLETALALVRSQTWRNLDIILCDNASTDSTQEICERAAREDSRIRYVRHAQNIGPTANFNHGASMKRGEFFMWAAHDDEKAPEFVAETVAALQRNANAAMACTWTTLITREGEQVHEPYSAAISSPRLDERLAAFIADTQCVAFYGLYRSAVIDSIGPMDDWLDNDRRYLFKAAIRGPFQVVPKLLFRFRWLNASDDYAARGFRMRPGAADFDLDLYRYFPRLLREAGVSGEEARRAIDAMRAPMKPYLDRRAAWLIARTLDAKERRSAKVRRLIAFARQYPPMLRNRMFWGALRRLLT
ncbi:MAG TPA: glycosyltransferase family A protein [Thermoanaerobaculia bacterium]|nr:glycosyltransferase family A protein [Thermoanaerobaculia bacterium]